MRLLMLAKSPNLYSHRRLVEAARARGHTIDVINTLQLHMTITSSNPVLRLGAKTRPGARDCKRSAGVTEVF